MTTPVPHLPGLVPIWQTAFELGVTEPALHAELHRAGVSVLEVRISGKSTLFANPADLTRFIAARAKKVEPEPQAPNPVPERKRLTLAERLAHQEAELEALRQRIHDLLATAGAKS